MGDLLAILSAAQSSLGAQRAITQTASHNIANANNPNYARQTANVEALVPPDQTGGSYVGRGSTLGSVTQARDRYLEAQLPAAFGNAARSTAESDALQAFHALDPGAGAGLDTAISGFYAALRALAQNPSDSGLRTAALGAARTMTQAFNRAGQQIEAARSGLDSQVTGLVATINGEARAIADLNVQIKQASASGSPNDLLDLRQQHIDKLAELTGASVIQTADGDVNLFVGPLALVSGPIAGSFVTQGDESDFGHLDVAFASADGSPPQLLAGSALGGTLGGTLAARDGALLDAAHGVDALAYSMATAINAANYDPVKKTGTVFTVLDPTAAVSGTAAKLALSLTDPADLGKPFSGLAGDATQVQDLIATENTSVTARVGTTDRTTVGVQATLSAIVSEFGASTATAKAFSDQDEALKGQLVDMRDSVSGVSIDDEMISIQTAQRGYEALSKVITAADEMLQTLMGIIK